MRRFVQTLVTLTMSASIACSFFSDTSSLTADAAPAGPDASDDAPRDDATNGDLDGGVADVVTAGDAIATGDSSVADASVPRCLANGPAPVFGAKSNQRGGLVPELVRPGYDLEPAIVQEGNTFVMWWSHEGEIARAESSNANGPWHSSTSTAANTWDTVFTGRQGDWDRGLTEPTVLHVNGVFYMYYVGTSTTDVAIGLATSSTGFAWTRANGGQPVVSAINASASVKVVDGPAAFYRDGKFYLAFSDSTAPATTISGTEPIGTYLIRSSQPTFDSSDVESLSASGWVSGDLRNYAVIAARGGDVAYLPDLDRVAFVQWSFSSGLHLLPLAPPLTMISTNIAEPGHPLAPGFVRGPLGTMPLSQDCTTLSVDYVREVDSDAGASDLARFGFDVRLR